MALASGHFYLFMRAVFVTLVFVLRDQYHTLIEPYMLTWACSVLLAFLSFELRIQKKRYESVTVALSLFASFALGALSLNDGAWYPFPRMSAAAVLVVMYLCTYFYENPRPRI